MSEWGVVILVAGQNNLLLRLLLLLPPPLDLTGPGAASHLILAAVLAEHNTHPGQHPTGQGTEIFLPVVQFIECRIRLSQQGIVGLQGGLYRGDLVVKGGDHEAAAQIQGRVNGFQVGGAFLRVGDDLRL